MTSTVNAVSTSPESPDGALLRPVGRLGTWLAVLWLVFLVEPLQTAWQERDTAAGMVGLIGTIVFAGVYMWVWLRFRLARARYRVEPPLAESLPALVVLLALSVVLGVVRGCTVHLGERDGALWMRYRAATIALWIVNIALKGALVPVEHLISPAAESAANASILFAIGLGVLYRRRTQPIFMSLMAVYAVIAVVVAIVRSRMGGA